MRIITGTILYDGTKTEDGKFVPLSDVKELIHSVDSIRNLHQKMLKEITNARVAMERLTNKKTLIDSSQLKI